VTQTGSHGELGVVGDVATDAAEKGINLTQDAKTLADAEAFFTWFKASFIPVVEQVYSALKTDVTGPASTTTLRRPAMNPADARKPLVFARGFRHRPGKSKGLAVRTTVRR
jgi:hypothetical protein